MTPRSVAAPPSLPTSSTTPSCSEADAGRQCGPCRPRRGHPRPFSASAFVSARAAHPGAGVSGTPSRSTTAGSASGWSPSGSPAARPRPREVLDRPPRRGGRCPEAVSSDDGATGRELPQLAPCSATCAPGLDRKKTIRGSQVLVGEQVRTGRLRVGALGPRYAHRPRAASLAISPDGASCERVQIAVYLLLGTD